MAEQLPVWNAVGVEPSSDLKTNGWKPGMKPSAQHMNWLLNRTYKVLEELQNTKVDKIDGKGLSTNDYTTAEKNKLAGIAAGANKTTVTNSLTSTSTTNALSANQGRVLKELVDSKASSTDLTQLEQEFMSHSAETKQRVFAIKTSNQTLISDTDTSVTFDILEKNSADASFAELENGKIKILINGEYEIKLGVCFIANDNGARRITPHHVAFSQTVKATDNSTYVSSSYRTFFTAGTLLNLMAYQNSGVALDVVGTNTRCIISRVG